MNTSTTPQWIDTEQVAAIYGIKKAMIERHRNCMVGGIKTGGLWRYNAAEIAEYVARTGRLFKPEAKAVPTTTTKPQKRRLTRRM